MPARSPRMHRRLEQAISGIEVGGNTALYGGVTRGAAEVRRHLARVAPSGIEALSVDGEDEP